MISITLLRTSASYKIYKAKNINFHLNHSILKFLLIFAALPWQTAVLPGSDKLNS